MTFVFLKTFHLFTQDSTLSNNLQGVLSLIKSIKTYTLHALQKCNNTAHSSMT
jgi:hypothetical protein